MINLLKALRNSLVIILFVSSLFNLINAQSETTGQDLDLLERDAKKGNEAAQNLLGPFYYYGIGTDNDMEKAFYWYKKSAERGNDISQKQLGVMYSQWIPAGYRFNQPHYSLSV